MLINELIAQRNLTKYRLSKNTNIPYSTISDICSEKTQLEKCSAEIIYKLAKELNVSMEDLLAPCMEHRCDFDLFKSNVCHRLKAASDIDFLIEVLESDEILTYFNRKWYPECLYLLAMVDYLSRLHSVPLCSRYNNLRSRKLQYPIYPASILVKAAVSRKPEQVKAAARNNSIPEFIRFNIIESEVRNVI